MNKEILLKRPKWWQKILLKFKSPYYGFDGEGEVINVCVVKHLFGVTHVVDSYQVSRYSAINKKEGK